MKIYKGKPTDGTDSTTVKSLVQSFKADKLKNIYILEEFLKKLNSVKSTEVKGGLSGIHKIFCLLIEDGDVKPPPNLNEDLMTETDKFHLLVGKHYSEAYTSLLKLLRSPASQIGEISLQVIFKLLQKEAQHPISKQFHSFPFHKYKLLLSTLIESDTSKSKLINYLQQFMVCDDFVFYTVKSLSEIADEEGSGKNCSDIYQSNILDVLEIIDIKPEGNKSLTPSRQFKNVFNENGKNNFKIAHKELFKYFNNIWETILSWRLSESACKRCLVLLPEKVMHHLTNPVSLTDFFISSYQRGGASALMSLHGVFVLITRYNVEYPDFYSKVYAMLEPNLFYTKYRPRFFILLNKFLSSTHLPQYILTAFAKRLSRLLLTAPTSCLVLLVRFIVSLVVRYPSLKIMVDNHSGIDHESDPFIEEETNLSKCRASESSLWELSTMLHHPIPAVAKAASFLERNFPEVELDINAYVEDNFEDVYEKCSKIKSSQVAATFVKPESLFIYPDDEMSQVWSML